MEIIGRTSSLKKVYPINEIRFSQVFFGWRRRGWKKRGTRFAAWLCQFDSHVLIVGYGTTGVW